MSDATGIKPNEVNPAQSGSAPVTEPAHREVVPLPEVLRQIREDAAKDPAEFLNQTAVPKGGE